MKERAQTLLNLSNPNLGAEEGEDWRSNFEPDGLKDLINQKNWPAWPPEEGTSLAKQILTSEITKQDAIPNTSRGEIRILFPVASKDETEARGGILEIRARRLPGKKGVAVVSPGRAQFTTACTRHHLISRWFEESVVEAFRNAASHAWQDSGKTSEDGVEIFIDGLADDCDHAVGFHGTSVGLAFYVALRCLWSGLALRENWCFTGEIDSTGQIKPVNLVDAKMAALNELRKKQNYQNTKSVFSEEPSGKDADLDKVLTDRHTVFTEVINQTQRLNELLAIKAIALGQYTDLIGNNETEFDEVGITVATFRPKSNRSSSEPGKEQSNESTTEEPTKRPPRENSEDDHLEPEKKDVPLTVAALSRQLSFLRGTPGLGKSFALSSILPPTSGRMEERGFPSPDPREAPRSDKGHPEPRRSRAYRSPCRKGERPRRSPV
ncbi:MAG: hypothetical protein MUC92_01810 [Fimbriimonadaceae bacterium]|jgi:hypothetical protein|nr:hypothetical protein [Fimbriimonadaceae bacterium]